MMTIKITCQCGATLEFEDVTHDNMGQTQEIINKWILSHSSCNNRE